MQNLNTIYQSTDDQMNKAIDHLEAELAKIRAGKASPHMLDGIMVDYYGSNTPLNQVSNITTPDARTIVIQPWEKGMLVNIEKSIMGANLGVTPMNDGSVIRLNIPPLTEERRKELVKKTKQEGEQTKVSIRNIRKDANDLIKKELKNGLPEDVAKDAETKVQTTTDQYILKVDKHLESKEKEIMTV
ncbi:MAG TPA: ribosome recycling factor [Bacteroidia bacterium]|nr:ribosome recycling factor [Bacteroidia bacterium]HNT80506.1 ribosome recycling factor [Bacteroidia bacterium]